MVLQPGIGQLDRAQQPGEAAAAALNTTSLPNENSIASHSLLIHNIAELGPQATPASSTS